MHCVVSVQCGFNICRWCGIHSCKRLAVDVGGSTIQSGVTTMLMEVLDITGVSFASTNHERQSATLLTAPDIHSKMILYVAIGHLCYLLFAFLA